MAGRLPSVSRLSFAVDDIDAAGDDDRGADPGHQVGQVAEHQITEGHRADQLAVAERRDHGGLGVLEGLDDEKMAEATQEPDRQEHPKIGQIGRRHPAEGQGGGGAQCADHGGVGDGGGVVVLARQAPGDHLKQRVTGGAANHQCRRPMGAFEPGPDDRQGADKADRHRGPAPGSDPFAQHRHRQGGDEEGGGEIDRRRGRQGEELQRREEQRRRAQQQERPEYLDFQELGAEQLPPPGRHEGQHDEQQMSGIAGPDDLAHRIVLDQQLDHAVHHRQQGHRQAHVEHPGQGARAGGRGSSRGHGWIDRELLSMRTKAMPAAGLSRGAGPFRFEWNINCNFYDNIGLVLLYGCCSRFFWN